MDEVKEVNEGRKEVKHACTSYEHKLEMKTENRGMRNLVSEVGGERWL